MALRVFNTLTRRKEDFVPRKRNFVRIYTCGLTVYDYMHIGHARTYIFWDVFRRYLKHSGYEIVSVLNYTDIEDKIIQRANERGIDFRTLADEFIEAFDDDCDALDILPNTVQCRATDYVPEMVEMVEKLVRDGFAYVVDGDVYFDVRTFPRYGGLSGQRIEDLEAGARVDVDERKRNPADFALWKVAKPNEPTWDSPWGKGRPGWHIECSVMSSHFLGDRLDVHGGAVDNMFPHHENEIAQSEAYFGLIGTDERWCNYFMHPEHLLVEDTKMSKSLGNFITVRQLLETADPNVVRLHFYTTHYRTQMNFTHDGLAAAENAWERIVNFMDAGSRRLIEVQDRAENECDELPMTALSFELVNDFRLAMDDDLNIPAAVGSIFEFIKKANQRGWGSIENPVDLIAALVTIDNLLTVLGLNLADDEGGDGGDDLKSGLMDLILRIRYDARERKDFAASDSIRDGLGALGITLEDTASGTRWHEK